MVRGETLHQEGILEEDLRETEEIKDECLSESGHPCTMHVTCTVESLRITI